MIQYIAKKSEEKVAGFGIIRHQMELDVAGGHLSRADADEVSANLEKLRGYAALQVMLYAQDAIHDCLLPWSRTVRWLIGVVSSRLLVSAWPLLDKRADRKLLHQPGFLILSLVPYFRLSVGILAIMRAEPRLYEIIIRGCERIYRKTPILRMFTWIIKPSMAALRWLYDMDWPQRSFSSAGS